MECVGKVGFNGSEISGFVPPIVSGNGSYVGELRRNETTFGLEVWNGTSWKANDGINTSKVQAIPTIQYFLIPYESGNSWITTASEPTNPRYFTDITTCFNTVTALASANPSNRYKVTIYPGVYKPTANISILNNMQVELMHGAEIANNYGSNFVISMTNGAILGSGVLNIEINSTISGNNLAIIHGSFFNHIICNGYTIIKANIINALTCNSSTCDVYVNAIRITNVYAKGKIRVSSDYLNSLIDNNPDSAVTNRIELDCKEIETVKAVSNVMIRGDILRELYCCVTAGNTFAVEVNVLEIGKVYTLYGYAVADIPLVESAPQGIGSASLSGKSYPVHCECEVLSSTGEYYCQHETQCLMKPYNKDGGIGEVKINETNYAQSQKSKLLIRANRRIYGTDWYLSIGTTTAIIEDYSTVAGFPHTYITGLYPGSNIDDLQYLTVLRLSNQSERGAGYQLAHNSALVLDNVNSNSFYPNVVTNSDATMNSTPHCATKGCTLTTEGNGNIVSLNTAQIRYSTSGTYGNVGRIDGVLIDNNADIIVNSNNWM